MKSGFSIRTLFFVTISLTVFVRLISIETGIYPHRAASLVIYFLAWILPCASFGFDQKPNGAGFLQGAMIGIAFCAVSLLALPLS